MQDLSALKEQLKPLLTREKVAEILSFIGYDISRDWKLKLRDEKTPSASISPTGYIKDFGDGWGGDVMDVLQTHHALSFPDSLKYVADCLGVAHE